MAKLSAVLKEPGFFLIWIGQVVSQFGDKLAQIALIGLIYKKAPGSTYELCKLFIFVIIPVFIVGPIAGAYSDRWSRKATMITTDIISGVLVLLIPLYWVAVPSLKPIFPVYIIVFALFSATRFFIPAKMAIIPEIVAGDKLLEANSLINTTGMIAAALGYGLGGILISMPRIGVKGGLILDAVSFFISAAAVSFVRVKQPALSVSRENIYEIGQRVTNIIKTTVWREIRDGVRYIFSLKKMQYLVALLFLLWSGLGATYVVLIVFIQGALSSMTRDLGLLIMLFGTGLFTGSIAYGKFGRRVKRTQAIFLSLVLSGIFLAQFVIFVGAYKNFYTAASLAFVLGAAISPIMISSNTIVHEIIEDNLMGRTFASLEAVMHLAFLIFMLISSIAAEFIPASYILLVTAAAFVFFGIAGTKIAEKRI